MTRCDYCGRTKEDLYYVIENNEEESIICPCCTHCQECRLLVDKHKPNKTKDLDDYYSYRAS